MTLIELRDMLDAAPGPSRELDEALHLIAYPGAGTRHLNGKIINVREYTASIDAALGLVDRLLPGWDWRVERVGPEHYHGMLWSTGEQDSTAVHGYSTTAHLALLLAAVDAKIAMSAGRYPVEPSS